MKSRLVILALLLWVGGSSPARAQEDYLTNGEVDALRDAQEPDKRLILWMGFAQRRIDGVKEAIASRKPESGRTIQKLLAEYVHLMEALQATIDDARERRVPLSKGLKEVETRGSLMLNYLRTLKSESIPGYKDFEYTLEESMDMTRDELAEVAKGNYPEIDGRKPPIGLPSRPPLPGMSGSQPPTKPQSGSPDAAEKDGVEQEGPPRKSQRTQ